MGSGLELGAMGASLALGRPGTWALRAGLASGHRGVGLVLGFTVKLHLVHLPCPLQRKCCAVRVRVKGHGCVGLSFLPPSLRPFSALGFT